MTSRPEHTYIKRFITGVLIVLVSLSAAAQTSAIDQKIANWEALTLDEINAMSVEQIRSVFLKVSMDSHGFYSALILEKKSHPELKKLLQENRKQCRSKHFEVITAGSTELYKIRLMNYYLYARYQDSFLPLTQLCLDLLQRQLLLGTSTITGINVSDMLVNSLAEFQTHFKRAEFRKLWSSVDQDQKFFGMSPEAFVQVRFK